ncbi:MAG: copper transporter [Solirubrobacterales bacterium]
MGYSARYHAASLAAVFIALAVGILIGVGFGSDVVNGTADSLENSLKSDLNEKTQQVEELQRELSGEREFEQAIYPTIVSDHLRGERIAVIGLGGLGAGISADIDAALEPTGASIGEVAVVDEPPSLAELASTATGRGSRELARGDLDALDTWATQSGRRLAFGGPGFDALRGTLLGRYSGRPQGLDAVIVVRQSPDGLVADEAEATDHLERGIVAGLLTTSLPVVGVEQTMTDPSTVGFFTSGGTSTVDDVDRIAGKVALVYALAGASGHFGVKESADSLLPDLLTPSAGS